MNIVLMSFGIATIANVSGMEKVFCEMANEFVRRGHDVTTVWNDEPGVTPFYPLDERVRQLNLGLGRIHVPIYYKIQRELSKTFGLQHENKVDTFRVNALIDKLKSEYDVHSIDVIVCYELYSVMVANHLTNNHIPTIAMSHNSIEEEMANFTMYQRKEASEVDVYQVLMPSYVEKAHNLVSCDVRYIPNVVPDIPQDSCADLQADKIMHTILHIGRVEPNRKRQLILIEAFSKIAHEFPDWQVHYYGPVTDAAYKRKIDEFVHNNKLEDKVLYKGVADNGIDVLKTGDIFAFPSSAEGFPLALTEAMGGGLPAIGFYDAASVNELIHDNENGYLCSDVAEFTEKLRTLMKDKEKRIKFGCQARKDMQIFSPSVVWNTWEALLKDVAKEHEPH
jgi:glycosyltransferase involved in cell wall biosynthesis